MLAILWETMIPIFPLTSFWKDPKMDDSADIQAILQDVGLKKRINDLDMQLGVWFDEGVQLSGGEWLKVALGRAFIRDAELYLLDEPNAALDSISERVILSRRREDNSWSPK